MRNDPAHFATSPLDHSTTSGIYGEPLLTYAEVGALLRPSRPLSARRVRELVTVGSRGVKLGCVRTTSGRAFTRSLVAAFVKALTLGSHAARAEAVRGVRRGGVGGVVGVKVLGSMEPLPARTRAEPIRRPLPEEVGTYPTTRTGWASAPRNGQMAKGPKGQMKDRPGMEAGRRASGTSAGCTGGGAVARPS